MKFPIILKVVLLLAIIISATIKDLLNSIDFGTLISKSCITHAPCHNIMDFKFQTHNFGFDILYFGVLLHNLLIKIFVTNRM